MDTDGGDGNRAIGLGRKGAAASGSSPPAAAKGVLSGRLDADEIEARAKAAAAEALTSPKAAAAAAGEGDGERGAGMRARRVGASL